MTPQVYRVPGVQPVGVDLETKPVTAMHGGSVSTADPRQGIEEAGYDVPV